MSERLDNNFQFIEVGRIDPTKKDAAERKQQFGEIYEPFKADEAAEQSQSAHC